MSKDLSQILSMDLLIKTKFGVEFFVYLVPGAKNEQILGIVETEHGKALKVAVHERPIENKANIALIGFLAKMLNVPKSNISIKRGHKSRAKRVCISKFYGAEEGT